MEEQKHLHFCISHQVSCFTQNLCRINAKVLVHDNSIMFHTFSLFQQISGCITIFSCKLNQFLSLFFHYYCSFPYNELPRLKSGSLPSGGGSCKRRKAYGYSQSSIPVGVLFLCVWLLIYWYKCYFCTVCPGSLKYHTIQHCGWFLHW